MAELESMVPELDSLSAIDAMVHRSAGENAWVCFESDVRAAAATALERLRGQDFERCGELLRLCEFEEQTRCQAFQATMMGEVGPAVYQATVNSIIEKLLGKLETWEPIHYQAAAQCLSDYMSALNHHCNICAVPRTPVSTQLPAIAEGHDENAMGSDVLDSSDYPSGSEDAETLSVHSEGGSVGRRISASELTADAAGFTQGFSQGALSVLGGASAISSGGVGVGGGSGSVCSSAWAVGGSVPLVTGGGGPTSTGSMTAAAVEVDEIRKERRREANKKASVKYRSKKAGSMQQLVNELAAARQQAGSLSSQVAVLSAENQLLKSQVNFLQSMMQQSQQQAGTAPPEPPPVGAGTVRAGAIGSGAVGVGAMGSGAMGLGAMGFGAMGLGAMGLGARGLGATGPAFSSGLVGQPPLLQPLPLGQATARQDSGAITNASPTPPQAPINLAMTGGTLAAAPAAAAARHSGARPDEAMADVPRRPDCGVGCGVSEWLTADANLRL